jgi:hypothetical protein
MSQFTVPVSMLASRGKGGALAAGVLGLLVALVILAQRDPTAPRTSNFNR